METSLHRQLKEHYADQGSRVEAKLGRFRIDVITDDALVEVQHGSLAAIRDKIRTLVVGHQVLVVKPIVRYKQLVKQDARGGQVVSRRRSPKTGSVVDLFDELVYFTRVFPHKNLSLEVAMVDIEEWRYPGHGRRRRRRQNDHLVEDQRLTQVWKVYRFHTPNDLWRLIPGKLPKTFDTSHLAAAAGLSRPMAQRVAFCLRETGAARQVGKQGNALLYERAKGRRSSKAG